jgi:hypothetical protein
MYSEHYRDIVAQALRDEVRMAEVISYNNYANE